MGLGVGLRVGLGVGDGVGICVGERVGEEDESESPSEIAKKSRNRLAKMERLDCFASDLFCFHSLKISSVGDLLFGEAAGASSCKLREKRFSLDDSFSPAIKIGSKNRHIVIESLFMLYLYPSNLNDVQQARTKILCAICKTAASRQVTTVFVCFSLFMWN